MFREWNGPGRNPVFFLRFCRPGNVCRLAFLVLRERLRSVEGEIGVRRVRLGSGEDAFRSRGECLLLRGMRIIAAGASLFIGRFFSLGKKGRLGGYPSSCVSLLFPDRMKKGRRGRRPVSLSCVSLACGGLSLSRVPLFAGGALSFSQVSFVSWRSVLPFLTGSFAPGRKRFKEAVLPPPPRESLPASVPSSSPGRAVRAVYFIPLTCFSHSQAARRVWSSVRSACQPSSSLARVVSAQMDSTSPARRSTIL